jgi:hypothetical protein
LNRVKSKFRADDERYLVPSGRDPEFGFHKMAVERAH